MEYVLELECRPLSWNQFYSGGHWNKRAELAHYYHAVVLEAVGKQSLPELRYPIQIIFGVTLKGRMMDVDNVCIKMFVDGLRYAGVIPNDTPEYWASYTVAIQKGDKDLVRILIPYEFIGKLF